MPPRRKPPTLDPTIGRDQPPVAAPAPVEPVRVRRRAHLPRLSGPTSRVTIDVATDDHRALKRTADDIADALGIGSVAVGQVMAALAHQVSADASLRESVTAYLRERVEQ